MNTPASIMLDFYKTYHPYAYVPGTEMVYSNYTNRTHKHSNIPGKPNEVVFVGLQAFIFKVLRDRWYSTFFNLPKDKAVRNYARYVTSGLGFEAKTEHLEKLHDLGYLPVEVKALPEGSVVPYGVPVLTIKSTVDGFGWVTNMLETTLSCNLWPIITSATTAYHYRKRFEESQIDKSMIKFMGHDFSYRGMPGDEAAAMVGFGHITSFAGSDTIPAAWFAEEYYGADCDKELIIASVPATEHSIQCSYGNTDEGQKEYLRHLMKEVTPQGILSVVSDGFDFWKLVTEYLPQLKDDIMSREGTLVIRPDSGDPVDILCGDINATTEYERKGLIEVLWDIFGGTVTENGYKLLDSHIGAIYGDSITLERQKEIINRLEAKGFVPSVVLGIGSYTYQYVTRDTHGSAVKATAIKKDGEIVEIYKDPKTGDGTKKSAKGLLRVDLDENGNYTLYDQQTEEQEKGGLLQVVFKDGKVYNTTTLNDIRKRLWDNF